MLQWDFPIPRAREFVVLSHCLMVCRAMTALRTREGMLMPAQSSQKTAKFISRSQERGQSCGELLGRQIPALLSSGLGGKMGAPALS